MMYQDLDIHQTPTGAESSTLGLFHPDRLTLQGIRKELKADIKSRYKLYKNHNPSNKFLIFGRARTGSSLLVSLMRQLPGVVCDSEILHYSILNKMRFIENRARLSLADTYGFKLLSYQLYEVQKTRDPILFFDKLLDKNYKIIHLNRNSMAQCLSMTVASKSQDFYSKGTSNKNNDLIEIDIDFFMKKLRWNEALKGYESYIMSRIEHLPICYETMLLNNEKHQGTIDTMSQYLGVGSVNVTANIKKTLAKNLHNVAKNADEIIKTVENSELAHLLLE